MVDVTNKGLAGYLRSVPDFPKQGVVFKDITTLLKDKTAFKKSVDNFYERYRKYHIDKVVSVESRGFIFGSTLAYRLNAGFVPVRKQGKLPSKTIRKEYQLEYGTDILEIHTDSINKGDKVLLVDDLLATGGTIVAACELVKELKGEIVGIAFLIELLFLKGREKLKGYDVYSIIKYEEE